MRSAITLTGLLCVAVLGLCGIPRAAHAQGYPTRPITLVVPFPAGGPSDVVARIVTEQMGKVLGQTLVIDGGWSSVSPAPGEEHFKEVRNT